MYTDPSGEVAEWVAGIIVGAFIYAAIQVVKMMYDLSKTDSGSGYVNNNSPINLNPNSSTSAIEPSGIPIRDGGFNANVPVGVFQGNWLESSTSSSIAYNTTGSNDWIANGSNIGNNSNTQNTENSNSSVGQPGTWESIIPIWGSGRSAVDHFQRGNYWRGAGHTVLAVSDVFLIKSIGTAIGKGAWKFGGSNAWRATRRWLGNRGYAKAGQPVHHWAIHQATAKKYGLEAITNQPWNLKTFATQGMHMRAGHGRTFLRKPGFGMLGRLWFGTPWWPKFFLGSYGGRLIGGSK